MRMQLALLAAVLRQVQNARRLIQQAGQELTRQEDRQILGAGVRWG